MMLNSQSITRSSSLKHLSLDHEVSKEQSENGVEDLDDMAGLDSLIADPPAGNMDDCHVC